MRVPFISRTRSFWAKMVVLIVCKFAQDWRFALDLVLKLNRVVERMMACMFCVVEIYYSICNAARGNLFFKLPTICLPPIVKQIISTIHDP